MYTYVYTSPSPSSARDFSSYLDILGLFDRYTGLFEKYKPRARAFRDIVAGCGVEASAESNDAVLFFNCTLADLT